MYSLCFVSRFFLFSSLSPFLAVFLRWKGLSTSVSQAPWYLTCFCSAKDEAARNRSSRKANAEGPRVSGLKGCDSSMPGHLVEVTICGQHTFRLHRLHSQWGLSICDYWWCNQNFASINFLGIYQYNIYIYIYNIYIYIYVSELVPRPTLSRCHAALLRLSKNQMSKLNMKAFDCDEGVRFS